MRLIFAMFNAERLNSPPDPPGGEGISNDEYEKSLRKKDIPRL
jgi:hypothetical protein